MGDGSERDEIERLLSGEVGRPVPPPSPDLIPRTIRRVRDWILVGDLLRLITFDYFWNSTNGDDGSAPERR